MNPQPKTSLRAAGGVRGGAAGGGGGLWAQRRACGQRSSGAGPAHELLVAALRTRGGRLRAGVSGAGARARGTAPAEGGHRSVADAPPPPSSY
jgi:hypothetical protein